MNRPHFEIKLEGRDSKVWMDGLELQGVRDVKVHQPLNGSPIVTLEFVAASVKGPKE
jgi:hypothetical protein